MSYLWGHVTRRGFMINSDAVQRLSEAEAKQRLEKYASLGTLTAGVIHEIKQPLTHLELVCELLKWELNPLVSTFSVDKVQRIEALFEKLQKATTFLNSIVENVNSFNSSDLESRTPVDVCEMLDRSIAMIQGSFKNHTTLKKNYELGVPLVVANPSRLMQVFINLLVNAMQAFPPKKNSAQWVSVFVRRRACGNVAVDVCDNGQGVAPQMMERIFDLHFTTKSQTGGTGMGLYLAREIIRSFGGEISVKSCVGLGSRFTVQLPAG